MVFRSLLPLAAAAAAGLVLTGAASAQPSPPLASMPMPPSASDPAPKDTGKKKAAGEKEVPRRKKSEGAQESGAQRPAATAQRRADPSSSAQGFERPKKYVPEEFDRGREDGPRAKPFVSEGGRPGMGMRF